MKRIWAPWRMTYLEKNKPGKNKEEGCIFCRKTRQKNDRANLILHRGKKAFVMMNLYPYSNGHLMVSPYQHIADMEKLDPETLKDMMITVQLALKAVRGVFNPDAFNMGINQGREAGAGIESHIHFHVVPRWNGDTNFMPVLAETRVIPERLESGYDRLLPFFPKGGKLPGTRASSGKTRGRLR